MNPQTESKILRGIVVALIITFVVVTLAGCSAVGDNGTGCLTTYGYEYDQVGVTGLTLKATGNEQVFISFEEMEAEYIDLEACVANTNTPGPNVEFIRFSESLYSNWSGAVYHYAILTAFIDTDYTPPPLERNCISDREFLRHEYTHHVLFLNGEEPGHENPAFVQCDALGPKTCNGQYCEK